MVICKGMSLLNDFFGSKLEVSPGDYSNNDCIVVVNENSEFLESLDEDIAQLIKKYVKLNSNSMKEVGVLRTEKHPFKLVFSPTGPLNRDYDDVRRIFEAAQKGVEKALKTGSKRPQVIFNISDDRFGKLTSVVAVIGALDPFYIPVLTREHSPEKRQKAESITITLNRTKADPKTVVDIASKLDAARWVFRDIGGTDPERMTPANITEYVKDLFPEGSPVKVSVIEGQDKFEKDYPLFAAVNRGVANVPKHSGRIVFLEYTGEGEVEQSLYLVGKGVVYDTGGHDLKVNGVMAGMHRDKCGSATVAGFFKFLNDTRPRGIRIVGAMALVRNAVGPNAYVADEIITARSGQRVAVNNTDAEGRMAMGDLLCDFKNRALDRLGKDKMSPHLFTVATLTGHVALAFGEGYSGILENGPAKKQGLGSVLKTVGESLADMFELSSLRREDYEVQKCKNEYADLVQSGGTGGTVRTPRGHQGPGAFLVMASGLDNHGIDSEKPLVYCHLDTAGGVGSWMKTDPPKAAALNALIGTYVLPKLDAAKPLLA